MSKFAVMLYPDFSLQEITCLTSALTVWYGQSIDYIASENRQYSSEEGLCVFPTKTTAQVNAADYDCVILPGTVNPLAALFDEGLINFLRSAADAPVLFAAISSAPALLSKAGILRGKKFTAGYFMQFADTFSFIEKENFVHEAVVEDGNVITAIGMFFREFAASVLRRLGYPADNRFMRAEPDDYTQEELTFYWPEEDYQLFLKELQTYQA